jgi:hypothetical protein
MIDAKRLSDYRIRLTKDVQGVCSYRVARVCGTGESHVGTFHNQEAAEDFICGKLPVPALTRGDG